MSAPHALRAFGSSLRISPATPSGGADVLEAEPRALRRARTTSTAAPCSYTGSGISAMLCGPTSISRASSSRRATRSTDARAIPVGRAQTIGTLGAIARDEGDEQRALRARRAERSARPRGRRALVGERHAARSSPACRSTPAGSTRPSAACPRESLAIAEQLRDRAGRVFGVGLLATVAAERGDSKRAGRLWGGDRGRRRRSRRSAAGYATAQSVRGDGSGTRPARSSTAATPRAAT